MTGFDIDNSKFGQGQEQISRKDKINYSTIRMGTGSRDIQWALLIRQPSLMMV